MTYKQIEAAREIRLWIGQIIVPAATVTVAAMTIPEVRQMIAAKADSSFTRHNIGWSSSNG